MSEPTPDASLGAALSTLRLRRTLSLRELSRLSGIDHAYLSRLETGGKDRPSTEVIGKLVKALKLNASDSKLVRLLALGPEATAAVKAERERVLAEVARFEGFISHHNDARAAREHNVKELRALIAKLRSEP